jgi:hypothetical protein
MEEKLTFGSGSLNNFSEEHFMDKYCQNCNKPNHTDAVFCRHCASPLSAGGSQQQQQQQQQRQAPPNYGNQQNFGNQQNYGNQQFNQQAGNFAPQGDKASGRATAALVLAICGLVCCGPFTGLPAAVVGWMEVSSIKEGRSSPKGMTMAQIGLWGGIAVSIIHGILMLLYMLAAMAGGGYR